MKRFHFRAAAVLDLRVRQHEMAQAELARVQQERDVAAGAMAAAEDALGRARTDYRERLLAGDVADALERHRNWILGQHAGVERCRQHLAEQQLSVERATADVRRTHRLARVLERLRDGTWRDYQKEARRLEMIEMDQLAVIQYARRMGGHDL